MVCGPSAEGTMKRLLIVMILALAAIAPVFAINGQIGVSAGYEWFANDTSFDSGTNSLALNVAGATYFGSEGGLGIEYGLGMGIHMSSWAGDFSTDLDDAPKQFIFNAGLGYRFHFGDMLGLKLGIGANGYRTSESNDYASMSTLTIGIYGRLALDVTIAGCVRIDLGAFAGGPVMGKVDGSSMGVSYSQDVDVKGIFVTPYAGISYAY